MCGTCWETAAASASMGPAAVAAGAAGVATTVHTWGRRIARRPEVRADDEGVERDRI